MNDNKIVLREPIEWIEAPGCFQGFAQGSPVAEIIPRNDGHYDIYILDGVRQVYAESLELAKAGAESTLIEWLNSTFTVREESGV